MAEAASRMKAGYPAAVVFICCIIVTACASLAEPPPKVEARPVYRVNGASAARSQMRQEGPKAQTIPMGEESLRQP